MEEYVTICSSMPIEQNRGYINQINDPKLKDILLTYITQPDDIKWEIILMKTRLNGKFAVVTIRWLADQDV